MNTDEHAAARQQLPVRRIFKLATALSIATSIGIYALPVIITAIWLAPGWFSAPALGLDMGGFNLSDASLTARLAGLAVALAGVVVQIYGLAGLRRTFEESVSGRWFSYRSIQGFRRFAWVSLTMVFIGIVQLSAWSVILSMGTPGVQNQLNISFGSADLTTLFTAMLFVFVAHIFLAGKAVDEENAAFI